MKLTIELTDLNAMIADFVQIGYMEAVKAYEPTRDMVRQSELKGWLKFMNVDKERFDRVVAAGLVRPIRKGKSANSPVYYSKEEIKHALTVDKIDGIVNAYFEETENNSKNDNNENGN